MIREYTNRECEANRLNPAEAVKRYTADEQALLNSLTGALERFKGEVVHLPPCTMSDTLQHSIVTRNNMTREELKERERIAKERRKMMCKNGCGVLAKYRILGICQRCYTAKLRAEKKSG